MKVTLKGKEYTVSLANFGIANTPPSVAKVANLVLKLSAALVLIGATIAMPPFAGILGVSVVSTAITVAGVAGSVGVLVKSLSKLVGIKLDDVSIVTPTPSKNGITS